MLQFFVSNRFQAQASFLIFFERSAAVGCSSVCGSVFCVVARMRFMELWMESLWDIVDFLSAGFAE